MQTWRIVSIKALRAGDKETVYCHYLKTSLFPFCRLRDEKKGYAVSLIKPEQRDWSALQGVVRAPLTMQTPSKKIVWKALN